MLERYAHTLRPLLAAPGNAARQRLREMLEDLRRDILALRTMEDALDGGGPSGTPAAAWTRRRELGLLRESLTTLWHEAREALDGPPPLRLAASFGHGCGASPSSARLHPDRGTLLVTDFGRPDLLEYALDGTLLRAHALGLHDPTRVLALADGTYLVCDRGHGRLLLLDPDLRPLRDIPFPPGEHGRRPYDIAAGETGAVVMTKDAAHAAPRWHNWIPDAAERPFADIAGPTPGMPVNCAAKGRQLYVTASAPNALLRHDLTSGATTVFHREPLRLWPTKVEPCAHGVWCAAEGRLVLLDDGGGTRHGARIAAMTGAARVNPTCLCALERDGRELLVVGDGVGRCLHLFETPRP